MKTLFVALIFSTLPLLSNANESNAENAENLGTENIELENLMNDLFEEKTPLIESENQQLKVVILNSDYRKVRVGRVENMDNINSESTLLPVIYRSVFLTKIHDTSYYMLKE
jgi:hypothetical protein